MPLPIVNDAPPTPFGGMGLSWSDEIDRISLLRLKAYAESGEDPDLDVDGIREELVDEGIMTEAEAKEWLPNR